MWSTFLSVFLGITVYTDYNIWIIFIIGIPAQVLISLCFGIKPGRRSNSAAEFIRKKRVRKSAKKNADESEAEKGE